MDKGAQTIGKACLLSYGHVNLEGWTGCRVFGCGVKRCSRIRGERFTDHTQITRPAQVCWVKCTCSSISEPGAQTHKLNPLTKWNRVVAFSSRCAGGEET